MHFFSGLLIIFFIVFAVLIILLVLAQDEQGEGMGGLFSGSSSTPFGSKGGSVIQRMTAVLGVLFFVSALGYAFITKSRDSIDLIKKVDTNESVGGSSWWKTPEAASTEEAPASIASQEN